ncbi:hypothetical protein LTR10_016748 [Elasticomyces elasticus]|uniref:Transcription factor domain-containing protein n=1 Tax=Exophiala sideris TaxID=1016849 RepID=A0ABR0JMM9_9EURO|nr:hypothetical protein LTR10_016748 [Elasticomyces elasticus]KAK5037752.1 hypothetical protein LTS07_001219 [Exophiala sideris]KAK5043734.1 hypothetical protein LTR13_000088 [Exophiala sideris]KAK5067233.1 hypothetical protein LTR69_001220 [Exophiala sideris]KAK5182566.1 hypothetical protein LTR44_004957 [Eurotiomycetes sp. CCFEE 6388]
MSTVVMHFLPDASLDKESLRGIVSQLRSDNVNRASERSEVSASPTLRNDMSDRDLSNVTDMPNSSEAYPLPSMDMSVQLPSASTPLPDLTVDVVNHLANGSNPHGPQSQSDDHGAVEPSSFPTAVDCMLPQDTLLQTIANLASPSKSADSTILVSPQTSWTSETVPTESVARKDDLGITRYDSGTSWTAFFCKIHTVIGPRYPDMLKSSAFVLNEPTSGKQIDRVTPTDLPSRADFEQASSKFFAEVNCVNYISSYKQFHTYTFNAFDQKQPVSHAVLMLLYLIMSLNPQYEEHFPKACGHVDATLEEGSLASVEALMLLMFNLTPNTPPDYYMAVAQLTRITGHIVQDLYGPRSARICLDTRADEILDDMQRFWDVLPPYLKPEAPVAPSHARAVLYLGLRYYYTILVATRPSILCCWKLHGSCSARLMRRVDLAEEANKASLLILRKMAQKGLLCKESFLDASYVLANIVMLILRVVKIPTQEMILEAEEYRPILDLTLHLHIGRGAKGKFEDTLREVRSMLEYDSSLDYAIVAESLTLWLHSLQGQFREVEQMAIDELLGDFMDIEEGIWPTWPTDATAGLSWMARTP